MRIKTIAMYLPQFHRTKENDEWWGTGFTDWISAQNAEKYDKEQVQPRVPLNNNYYNLLNRETMLWQASIAKKYNVYGFAFYHYWFAKGRKVLEKPAENLLQWKEIDIHFCFSWANVTWARSWSKLANINTWTDIKETHNENDDGVLLLQDYGQENDWRIHYEYLLPFFKDSRYIKIDNKPVFIVNVPDEIICASEMITAWNRWGKEDGFGGVYFVATNPTKYMEKYDARMLQEPNYAHRIVDAHKTDGCEILFRDYDEVWNHIIDRREGEGIKTFLGGFCDYDDTPRRGKRGIFYKNVTPEKFRKYFRLLVAKSIAYGNEFVFLNAWNEWGEGMYLEPDDAHQFKYLEAIRDVVADEGTLPDEVPHFQKGSVIPDDVYEIILHQMMQQEQHIKNLQRSVEKLTKLRDILDKWMVRRENGFSLYQYFKTNKIQTIAVYGMGILGQRLVAELIGTDIKVKYGIDRQGELIDSAIPIKRLEDVCESVDMVVVTILEPDEETIKNIRKVTNTRSVLLEDMLY